MELKRIIAVSKSVKVQHEHLGGNRYEGTDFWSSESEEVPADLPHADVEDVRLMLRERVEADIAREVLKLKDGFRKAPGAPAPARATPGTRSVKATPTAPVPDGPNGEPWA